MMGIVKITPEYIRFYRAGIKVPDRLPGYMPHTFRTEPGKYTAYSIGNRIVNSMFETLVLHSMFMWNLNETN